jgi:hypothetical protein
LAQASYFPVHTILSPQLGQSFQSDRTSKPHLLHFTIAAIAGILHPLFYFVQRKSIPVFLYSFSLAHISNPFVGGPAASQAIELVVNTHPP